MVKISFQNSNTIKNIMNVDEATWQKGIEIFFGQFEWFMKKV